MILYFLSGWGMQQNCAIECNRLRELGQFCNSACDQDPAPIHESCFRLGYLLKAGFE
jgi:hypothetical protein